MSGGSLSSLITYFGPLKEPTIRLYTEQILQGLAYLHRNGIVHRGTLPASHRLSLSFESYSAVPIDIKGANILVDISGKVKLADFGCSKQFSNAALATAASCNRSLVGTPWWMAPEVVRQSGYGRQMLPPPALCSAGKLRPR